MNVGSLVQYTAREGEPPSPAIVMRLWPEGTFELHVFHFESTAHIRAADPSQVVAIVDGDEIQEILQDFTSMSRRILDLELEMEDLRRELRTVHRGSKEQPDSAMDSASSSVPDTELPPLALKGTTVSSDEPVTDPTSDPISDPSPPPFGDEVLSGDSDSDTEQQQLKTDHVVESTRHQKKRAAWPR